MEALLKLYNGIQNDASIKRYSMGWGVILSKIERRYKTIPQTDEQFTDQLVLDAMKVTKGHLHNDIKTFAKELNILKETVNSWYK